MKRFQIAFVGISLMMAMSAQSQETIDTKPLPKRPSIAVPA